MVKNERHYALMLLIALIKNKQSLSQLMPPHADISPVSKEICFGFCRHFYRLQAIAETLVKKRPKEIELWILILMGIYQLHYMNQPDYAVVKETVNLLEKIKKNWAKPLVNAVLRNFCRQKDVLIETLSNKELYRYGHPLWLLKRLKQDWPNYWQSIMIENDQHPPMILRVNIQKTTVSNYLEILHHHHINATIHLIAKNGIILETPCPVTDLPYFKDGYVSVQDAAAQLAVDLLNLEPGLRVLDACCAPGGKLCHILEEQTGLLECIGLDVDSKRLNRVKENLARLNLKTTLLEADAANPSAWWDGVYFDRILLDAPCSATGVIRRHSDIKLLRTEQEIEQITLTQSMLLNSLWPLLAPHGIVIYATCSIIPAENEEQIMNFIKNHPDCALLENKVTWGQDTGYGQQILPGDNRMDGFFYAALKKIPVN